eukprot:CAMPEP_0185210988 /NCGR_PEP_ID=MMETSP1140-20130426/66690_1 /TAXON_ID=298111 /ORGANISM="Pavlova sp., Strain CCMP459" /LENGTH=49 /DNA_ID= /DNA_START= /DNA_END= /DNA_ORIENTATION=
MKDQQQDARLVRSAAATHIVMIRAPSHAMLRARTRHRTPSQGVEGPGLT